MTFEEQEVQHKLLLKSIKKNTPKLIKLLEEINDHWAAEDNFYRYYHHSFKVYRFQDLTIKMVDTFRSLLPKTDLNKMFMNIVDEGTGKEFKLSDNARWEHETRPIVEAFLHAKFFLEMIVKYSTLKTAPHMLPSGWATVLCLYDFR